MVRILLVDDEEIVRDGLCDIIDYLQLDEQLEIITAIDGEDALQKIYSQKPHIMITDMNMPRLDGLTLIQHLVSNQLMLKIIVISGYDEFHLVKESFKLGVTDYLLKPVHTEELREALVNSISSLEDEQQKLTLGQYEQSQSLIEKRSMELNFLMNEIEVEEAQFEQLFRKLDMDITYPNLMVAMIMVLEKHSESVSWQMKLAIDLMGQSELSDSMNIYPVFNASHDLVLWINFKEQPNLTALVSQIKEQYSSSMFVVACGNAVEASGHLQEAYLSAYEVAKYKLNSRAFTIIDSRIFNNRKQVKLESDDIKWLVELIDNGRKEEVQDFINRYFHDRRLGEYTYESMVAMYETIMQVIQWLPSKKRQFSSFEQPEQLRIYLKTCIFQTIDARRELLSSHKIIEVAKRYVQEHLHDEINMAVVANYCNVSYFHFSKLFKEAVGLNFQEYVTQCRMEYAKRALEGLNVKVNEVSAQLGYSNPKNFTRVFKNYYGMSPKNYQESIKLDH